MFYWLLQRVLWRGFKPRRGKIELGELEKLARSGAASWLLAQEKARLEFLAAREHYERLPTWRSLERVLECLLQLQSTSAVVQALVQEQQLTQMLARSEEDQALPARDVA